MPKHTISVAEPGIIREYRCVSLIITSHFWGHSDKKKQHKWLLSEGKSLYLKVNSLGLTHGHIYSPRAHLLATVYLCLRLMCALILHLLKNVPVRTHKHARLNTHTCTIDSETDPTPSSTARISPSDGWKLPSKPGPGGVQTVCLFEWTRHQSPIPSAMLIK